MTDDGDSLLSVLNKEMTRTMQSDTVYWLSGYLIFILLAVSL